MVVTFKNIFYCTSISSVQTIDTNVSGDNKAIVIERSSDTCILTLIK